jgi:hypothetical protein
MHALAQVVGVEFGYQAVWQSSTAYCTRSDSPFIRELTEAGVKLRRFPLVDSARPQQQFVAPVALTADLMYAVSAPRDRDASPAASSHSANARKQPMDVVVACLGSPL